MQKSVLFIFFLVIAVVTNLEARLGLMKLPCMSLLLLVFVVYTQLVHPVCRRIGGKVVKRRRIFGGYKRSKVVGGRLVKRRGRVTPEKVQARVDVASAATSTANPPAAIVDLSTFANVDGSAVNGSTADSSTAVGTAADGSAVDRTAASGSAADGSAANGSATVGSAADGSAAVGSATDGSAVDGSAADDSAADGSAADGSAVDGSTADDSAVDGSAADGSAVDGSAADGSAADGSAADGLAVDPPATVEGAADASTPTADSIAVDLLTSSTYVAPPVAATTVKLLTADSTAVSDASVEDSRRSVRQQVAFFTNKMNGRCALVAKEMAPTTRRQVVRREQLQNEDEMVYFDNSVKLCEPLSVMERIRRFERRGM